MFGQMSHSQFVSKIVQSKWPLLNQYNVVLSSGAVHYYLHNEAGWYTRVFLHNYFNLLADAPFPAIWKIFLFDRLGKKLRSISGSFGEAETAMIDLRQFTDLDQSGIIEAHVIAQAPGLRFSHPYRTVFFVEHYLPDTTKSIIAHSLGLFEPTHFSYHRVSTGWITPINFRPYLFIGSSCNHHSFGHSLCSVGTVSFINYKNKRHNLSIPAGGPRSCRKLDLYKLDPYLLEHLEGKPYYIEIDGKNILSKPFLFQTDGVRAMAEHL